LSARLHGSNDSALRSRCGLLRGRHLISSLRHILQRMYMRVEGHALSDCDQRSSHERRAGEKVDSLHEEAKNSNRMNLYKSNRGRDRKKRLTRGLGTCQTWHRARDIALPVKKLNEPPVRAQSPHEGCKAGLVGLVQQEVTR
jgi:hypothetical protein